MIEHRTQSAPEPLDPALRRQSAWIVLSIAIVAILTPAQLAFLLWGQHQAPLFPLGGLPLLVALLLGAVASGIAALWRGLDAIARDLSAREDSEHEQIIIRVIFASIVLDYAFGALSFNRDQPSLATGALAMGIGVVVGWFILLHLLMSPDRSFWRRQLAMLIDLGFLSLYMHFGGGSAAAWFGLYLWLGIGYGLRYGLKSLFQSTAMAFVGFSAVVATTPFWYERLPLAFGLLFALLVLPAYLTSLIRNLTEAKAQADAANAAKSRFLAIMSHELRTPLNAMIGMDAILRRTRLDARQRDMLATMNSSARALLALINDILDISKIEAGKFELDFTAVELPELVEECVNSLQPLAKRERILLRTSLAANLPAVIADPR